MKKIFYVMLAAVLLSSCTGVAPFSKQKYGHYKWIHKGAVVENNTSTVQHGTATEKQHTTAVAVQTETQQVVKENNNNQPVAEVNVATQPAAEKKTNVQHHSNTNHPVSVTETNEVKKPASIKKMLRKVAKPGNTDMDDDVRLIIAILLCIILPPMGVYLYRETGSPFVLTLILCLLSLIGFWFFWYSGLLWLIAVIIALLAVLQDA